MCRMLKPESNDASSATKTYYEWESGGIPLHCHTHAHTQKRTTKQQYLVEYIHCWAIFLQRSQSTKHNVISTCREGRISRPKIPLSFTTMWTLTSYGLSPLPTFCLPCKNVFQDTEPNATLYQRTLLLLPCINPHGDQTWEYDGMKLIFVTVVPFQLTSEATSLIRNCICVGVC